LRDGKEKQNLQFNETEDLPIKVRKIMSVMEKMEI
jgi:hypothetical protein